MLGVAAVCGACSASGHHAPIIFDQDSVISLQGTISRFDWTRESLQPGDRVSARANPDRVSERAHGLLIEIEKEDGTILSPTGGLPGGARLDSAASSLAGHWEAENVLVVDTALFADHRSTFPGSGLPSGTEKRVLERDALHARAAPQSVRC